MAISTSLTESPTNPQRDDPDNFRSDADDYVNWHTQTFVPEMNTVIDDLNSTIQNLFVGTSTTSNTVATGSKTWTMVEDNLAFGIGNSLRIADSSDPTTNYMSGIITAYNKTTKALTVTVDTSTGSGTKTAWTMTLQPPDEYNRVQVYSSLSGAASVPLVVEHSGAYYVLVTNTADVTADVPGVSAKWVSLGNSTYEEFTSSGTWTKPAGCRCVYVQIVFGGNSGGVMISDSAAANVNGGGGGVCLERIFRASDLSATETITVGGGGGAVTATGLSVANTAGSKGGASAFGSFTGPISTNYAFSAYGTGEYSYRGGNVTIPDSFLGGASGGTGYGLGGTSYSHGDGGDGSSTTDADSTASAGAAPGGGGGAAIISDNITSHTATSGKGGDGAVRIWTW